MKTKEELRKYQREYYLKRKKEKQEENKKKLEERANKLKESFKNNIS